MLSSPKLPLTSLPWPELIPYSSYAPRIKAGIKFYREEVKAAIDAGDFAGVATLLGPGSKASKLAYVDKYASGVVGEVIELKGELGQGFMMEQLSSLGFIKGW